MGVHRTHRGHELEKIEGPKVSSYARSDRVPMEYGLVKDAIG